MEVIDIPLPSAGSLTQRRTNDKEAPEDRHTHRGGSRMGSCREYQAVTKGMPVRFFGEVQDWNSVDEPDEGHLNTTPVEVIASNLGAAVCEECFWSIHVLSAALTCFSCKKSQIRIFFWPLARPPPYTVWNPRSATSLSLLPATRKRSGRLSTSAQLLRNLPVIRLTSTPQIPVQQNEEVQISTGRPHQKFSDSSRSPS